MIQHSQNSVRFQKSYLAERFMIGPDLAKRSKKESSLNPPFLHYFSWSNATFNFNTFTRGSPNIPNDRPSVYSTTSLSSLVTDTL